ncbi:hypothetical protein [uncultured Tateyamaria sp.]|uniref:hypothetical protein n=1 Tax=uncultured Tateyamaria sp. TaxID=455651 RepID=UPI00261648F0|nr:hypothetical protein [uncultured Tateyamaria sp.]
MAILRTYAEVLDQEPTTAETDLIEASKAGVPCALDDGACPTSPDPARTIRADILRYLLLGGCEACAVDERGVHLIGGYITGALDLNLATTHGAVQLENCHFESRFDSAQTRFRMVNLSGSILKDWVAQGAVIEGNVFLHDITAAGTIDLKGTTIGGQLDCARAHLAVEHGTAFNAQGAKIEGDVFLDSVIAFSTLDLNGIRIGGQLGCTSAQINVQTEFAISAPDAHIAGGVFLHPRVKTDKNAVTKPFHSTGEIRLNGATIGGLYAQQTTLIATRSGQSLSLGGATVQGAVRLDGCDSTGEILLAGARISGRLTCERVKLRNDSGHAFNGKAMRVEHAFVWKKVEHASGAISLNGAHVAELDDHPDNWPDRTALYLDGFTYDRIRGKVSASHMRMDWLENGSYFDDEFRPQPYSQYAKFLRETGHDEDARRVMFTRERLRRASAQDERRKSGRGVAVLLTVWFSFWNFLLRLLVGYGHYPFRSVAALAVLILGTIVPAHFAWEEGSFAPNAPPVLVSDDWTVLAETDPHPAAAWAGDRLPAASDLTLAQWRAIAPGRDWETFNRYAYGFDVVIPIIDFGQTAAWSPSTTRGPWGFHLWWGSWILTVMGWIVTALGAAAITGIIRRE